MPTSEITEFLLDWSKGDAQAFDRLYPLVEKELHRLARHYLRGDRANPLLQTTVLINEMYLRLVDQQRVQWQNRAHFFGIAAQMMRRVLLNQARDQHRLKRGGGAIHLSISEAEAQTGPRSIDLLALDEALVRLADFDRRKSQVVELRYFGGLSIEEIAEVMRISPITVMRDWNLAKAWLARELRPQHGG